MKVVDERVTLLTDPEDSPSTNGGFDADGFPLEKVVWIENGVVKNLNYDRFWAQKQGKAPTRAGIGGGFGGGFGGGGRALRIIGGTATTAGMIRRNERGDLGTRFWDIPPFDPPTLPFT